MTKEQFIQIAKAGFPEHVIELINFEDSEMMRMGDVYRLYDKNEPFRILLPNREIINIHLFDNFVQIDAGSKAFNQYAAIKEIEKMRLITSV